MSVKPNTDTPQPTLSTAEFAFLVAALTSGQACGTLLTVAIPTIAPAVAASFAIPTYMVGYQVALIYTGVLIGLVFGANFSRRWGACRTTQIALLLQAVGILLASSRVLVLMAPASIFIGLGYALLTPASSHLLLRFTPQNRRNIVFSMKQTGVPFGALAAALSAPSLTLLFGWPSALWLYAAVVLTIAVAMQWRRRRWDDDRDPRVPLAVSPFAALAVMWRIPTLRRLSIVAALLICSQMTMQNFGVTMLVEQLKIPLVQAGLVLSAAQVGGIGGRIFWGWTADRIGDCLRALLILGGLLLGVAMLCAMLTPNWSLTAVVLLFFLLGTTASGWHGAYLSEAARLSPPGQVAVATSGSLLMNNASAMLTPLVFAGIYSVIHNYAYTFGALVVPTTIAMIMLWQDRRPTATR